jgi:hypothetical protein
MHPDTRTALFSMTIETVCTRLDLSARAAVELVARGLLAAVLPHETRHPTLADARFRGDQVVGLLERAPGEISAIRDRYPRRTRDWDRANAFGALLTALGR